MSKTKKLKIASLIIVAGGIGLGLAELEIIEGRAAARQSQHQQDY